MIQRAAFSATVLLVIAALSVVQGQTYKVLHSFDGSDGASPDGELTRVGSTLYGTTYAGGGSNKGTIFSIGIDGSNCSVLHSFAGGAGDGAGSHSGLVLSGSTFYGVTASGGGNNQGTVFGMSTDGAGFGVLHSFVYSAGDGTYPYPTPTLRGSTLYGTTYFGGAGGSSGTIFCINANDRSYSIPHTFDGVHGANPNGAMAISGSTLYGATGAGGSNGNGVLFKMNADSGDYSVLHSFVYSSEGQSPRGNLILSGDYLYGATNSGGLYGGGSVFKMRTDGTDFSVLHMFGGSGSGDASRPSGGLVLGGSTLYGATYYGGSSGWGSLFQINIDGSDYSMLHSFTGANGDGKCPYGGLVLSDSTLYGTTQAGGSNNLGVVFAQTVPEPSTFALLAMGAVGLLGYSKRRRGA